MLMEIANGSIAEGDGATALQYLSQAEQLEPNMPELHHSKALAFHLRNYPDLAIESARKSVQIYPRYMEANNTLGKLLLDAGKYSEAEAPLLVAANEPLNHDAYKSLTNLGILYYRTGEEDKALKSLDRAIVEAPMQACVAHYYRGHLSLKRALFQDAVQHYEKATQKFCVSFTDAHIALGIAFERNGQYNQARKKFLEIRQNFPNTKIAEQATERLKHLP